MKTTIEQRKEKAVELMKQLQIYKPYINDFKKDNLVTYFERHIGYWAFQDEELNNKIKELQIKEKDEKIIFNDDFKCIIGRLRRWYACACTSRN